MADADGDPTYGVDANAVAAMFQNAGTDPAAEVTDDPGTAPVVADPTPATAPEAPQTTEQQESQLGPLPDLSDLDPAARAIVEKRIADFQSGFTKRTTELSEANKFLQDAGMTADEALEAAQFVQQIQSDPEARAGLYQALKEQFEAENGPATPTTPTVEEDPLAAYEDLPPEIRQRLLATDKLTARLDALDAAESQRAEEAAKASYLQEIEDNLATQWDGITKANPDLADETVAADIYALGAATKGDLVQATARYRAIENRIQAKMRAGATVQGGTTTPPAGAGHSTEPPPELSFEDGSVGNAALEFLRANSGA